jgi:hypothetical protein
VDLPQRLARRQETDAAGVYGGKLVSQSGSGDDKGDVITPGELIECKHTERKSFSLKLTDLMTAAKHAILADRRMVFEVEFTKPDGSLPVRFVVLNRDEYIALRDRYCGEGCTGYDCDFCGSR